MLTTKLSLEMLSALILAYESSMAEKEVSPLPIEFLTRCEGPLGAQALNSCIEDRESLESMLKIYEDLVCNGDIPTLDMFAFILVRKGISKAHAKFRISMTAKGVEHVYDNAYYADMAAQLCHFFEEFDESAVHDEDTMVNILDCALRDGFFGQLRAYAADKSDFDLTDLETVGDEIATYCAELTQKRGGLSN